MTHLQTFPVVTRCTLEPLSPLSQAKGFATGRLVRASFHLFKIYDENATLASAEYMHVLRLRCCSNNDEAAKTKFFPATSELRTICRLLKHVCKEAGYPASSSWAKEKLSLLAFVVSFRYTFSLEKHISRKPLLLFYWLLWHRSPLAMLTCTVSRLKKEGDVHHGTLHVPI